MSAENGYLKNGKPAIRFWCSETCASIDRFDMRIAQGPNSFAIYFNRANFSFHFHSFYVRICDAAAHHSKLIEPIKSEHWHLERKIQRNDIKNASSVSAFGDSSTISCLLPVIRRRRRRRKIFIAYFFFLFVRSCEQQND